MREMTTDRNARSLAGSAQPGESYGQRTNSIGRSSGFSLIELLVVLAIILVVAAFAIPTMMTTLDAYRIRGSLTSVSGLAQRTRLQAIKQDLSQRMHFATCNSKVVLFVTTWNDANVCPVAGDPNLSAQYWLSSQFSIPGAPSGPGAPSVLLDSTMMWGTSVPVGNINKDPYFNSRGIPCVVDPVTGVCSSTTGFIFYYRYTGGGTATRWAATSISPVGRMQSWFWNGTSWGN
jgi:prepilin-type N-terminal cleavage/methylation domain-containing protein